MYVGMHVCMYVLYECILQSYYNAMLIQRINFPDMYVAIYLSMFVCMYLPMHACMYVWMYVCINLSIYLSKMYWSVGSTCYIVGPHQSESHETTDGASCKTALGPRCKPCFPARFLQTLP